MDKCEKHDDTMNRVFNEITEAKVKLESINTKLDAFIEFKDMMHKIVFGNGKEGIISKINRAISQQALTWSLFVIMLFMLVGIYLKQ